MPSSALETSLTYPFSYYRNFLCYLFNGNNSPKPTAALEAHDHTQHVTNFSKREMQLKDSSHVSAVLIVTYLCVLKI